MFCYWLTEKVIVNQEQIPNQPLYVDAQSLNTKKTKDMVPQNNP